MRAKAARMGHPPMRKLAIASVLLACACTFVGCMCSDKVLSRSTSPDGGLVATVFERDCGATTDFSTILSISGTSENFKDERVFVFVAKGQKGVTVKWTGRRALWVECDGCTRPSVFRQVTALGDIDITYSLPSAVTIKPQS